MSLLPTVSLTNVANANDPQVMKKKSCITLALGRGHGVQGESQLTYDQLSE